MIRAFAIASAFALVAIATQIDDSRPEPCSCRDTALVCSLPVTFEMSTRSGRLLIQEAPGKGANATCLNRNLWKNVPTPKVEVLQKSWNDAACTLSSKAFAVQQGFAENDLFSTPCFTSSLPQKKEDFDINYVDYLKSTEEKRLKRYTIDVQSLTNSKSLDLGRTSGLCNCESEVLRRWLRKEIPTTKTACKVEGSDGFALLTIQGSCPNGLLEHNGYCYGSSNWTRFTYDVVRGFLVVYGSGFSANLRYAANLTWPNGTSFLTSATSSSLVNVTFALKNYTKNHRFEAEKTAVISIRSPIAVVPFEGERGNDSIVLASKHPGCVRYHLLTDVRRKVSNMFRSEDLCDAEQSGSGGSGDGYYSSQWLSSPNFSPNSWHRFDDTLGGRMPESCPPSGSCGTFAPGWLRGSHPQKVGEEENKTVCFNYADKYFYDCCCCQRTFVQTVNCGTFYVYNLPTVPACPYAYCADA
ncbi:uncharacterized protein [Oscarella lobularis]|uniref:uncharacterized protein isoform X2 n=1 Tax=Oscarella lobularis TaxID=121494 RepID=UPI0033137063